MRDYRIKHQQRIDHIFDAFLSRLLLNSSAAPTWSDTSEVKRLKSSSWLLRRGFREIGCNELRQGSLEFSDILHAFNIGKDLSVTQRFLFNKFTKNCDEKEVHLYIDEKIF